jgi:hypothetical protein
MAVSVNWATKVITIPQSDLTDLGDGRYELDVDAFRLELKALEDDTDGIVFDDTHAHRGTVTISGVTYSRFVEMINGYTVTISPSFSGQVACTGANHNIGDVYNNLTGPTLLINNSAGLQTVETGVSGLTPDESTQLSNAASDASDAKDAAEYVEGKIDGIETDADTAATQATAAATAAGNAETEATAAKVAAQAVESVANLTRKLGTNRAVIVENPDGSKTITIYDDDDTTPLHVYTVAADALSRTPA